MVYSFRLVRLSALLTFNRQRFISRVQIKLEMNFQKLSPDFEFFLENPVLTLKTRRIDIMPLYRRVLLLDPALNQRRTRP